MIIDILLFITGLVLLWKGADILVEGATKISFVYGIPEAIIGLGLIAFGTSAPELVVNLIAGKLSQPDIVFGNIIGSNIANTFLILGVTSLIFPIHVKQILMKLEIPLGIVISIVLALLIFFPGTVPGLTPLKAFVLFAGFLLFLYYLLTHPKTLKPHETKDKPKISLNRSWIEVVAGSIALPIGAKLLIGSAMTLSDSMGIPTSIISLVAVAFGTSLPELAASLQAALKRKPDMAIGNVVGSNIFNVLGVLGFTGILYKLPFDPLFIPSLGVMIASSILLYVVVLVRPKLLITRLSGIMFLGMYIIYIYKTIGL